MLKIILLEVIEITNESEFIETNQLDSVVVEDNISQETSDLNFESEQVKK